MRLLAACALASALLAGASAMAGEEGAAAPAASMTFAAGEGQAQVVSACAACHPPAIVTGKRHDAEGWTIVVEQMIDKGAQVPDEDFDAIVAYLARHYGAQPGG